MLTNRKVSAGTVSLRVCLRDLSDFTRDSEYCRHRQRGRMCWTVCVCARSRSPVLGERSEVGDLECVGVGLVVLLEDDPPRALLPILHHLVKTEPLSVSVISVFSLPSISLKSDAAAHRHTPAPLRSTAICWSSHRDQAGSGGWLSEG